MHLGSSEPALCGSCPLVWLWGGRETEGVREPGRVDWLSPQLRLEPELVAALQSRQEKWPNSPVLSYMPATRLLLDGSDWPCESSRDFFFTFAHFVCCLSHIWLLQEHILPKIVRDELHVGFACTIEPVKTVSNSAKGVACRATAWFGQSC